MKPVLFLDSGIGGIPYCRYFHQRNPGQSIVYLADRLHFPYGNWEKAELAAVLIKLVEQLVQTVNPQIIVVACNTATLAALSQLREHFPALPFVGTVPAVKPAALASKTGKIGVLGTELTIKESYIRELAAQYGNGEITGIAAPELVEFIENRLDSATPEEKREIVRRYLNHFRAAGVDAVVLGCTHFLFLEEDFRQEAAPGIAVFESVKGISQRIESLLAEAAPQEETVSVTHNRLLLTGTDAPEPSWAAWAEGLGFDLSLLGEL
ncbi:MAG: glutamate racemase [Treponema sp.]|jgi:glutamate racemase|nr:glutamate racemase [Treponema sp.]